MDDSDLAPHQPSTQFVPVIPESRNCDLLLLAGLLAKARPSPYSLPASADTVRPPVFPIRPAPSRHVAARPDYDNSDARAAEDAD